MASGSPITESTTDPPYPPSRAEYAPIASITTTQATATRAKIHRRASYIPSTGAEESVCRSHDIFHHGLFTHSEARAGVRCETEIPERDLSRVGEVDSRAPHAAHAAVADRHVLQGGSEDGEDPRAAERASREDLVAHQVEGDVGSHHEDGVGPARRQQVARQAISARVVDLDRVAGRVGEVDSDRGRRLIDLGSAFVGRNRARGGDRTRKGKEQVADAHPH